MNVLIFGRGVIGSLYGNAFERAGHRVVHLVRAEKLGAYPPLELDVWDERERRVVQTRYAPPLIAEPPAEPLDLLLVSVRHYQVQDVARALAESFSQTTILFFGNQWGTLDELRARFAEPSRILFGMPRAGGAIQDGALRGALLNEVILEKPDAPNAHWDKIRALFDAMNFRLALVAKMQDWFWTHLATTVAWICGSVEARGFGAFARSYDAIKRALDAGKEALEIVKRRGADISVCDDAQPFLLPSWLGAFIVKLMLKRQDARRISEGHGDYAPEELTRIYADIVQTGKTLGASTALLERYAPYFEQMNAAKRS